MVNLKHRRLTLCTFLIISTFLLLSNNLSRSEDDSTGAKPDASHKAPNVQQGSTEWLKLDTSTDSLYFIPNLQELGISQRQNPWEEIRQPDLDSSVWINDSAAGEYEKLARVLDNLHLPFPRKIASVLQFICSTPLVPIEINVFIKSALLTGSICWGIIAAIVCLSLRFALKRIFGNKP